MTSSFDYAGPFTSRLRCPACRQTGWPGGKWMDRHRMPHAPCPDCGTSLLLKLDGTPRVHTRCPNRYLAASAAIEARKGNA